MSKGVRSRGGFTSRPAMWMPQHDGVGIAGDCLDCIMQRFALRYGRIMDAARCRNYAPAQTLSGGLEGKVGAGGRLVENVGDHSVSEETLGLSRSYLPIHALGTGEESIQNF